MTKQLTAIDDVIRYQIGNIIIALQWVAYGAYTVVTTRCGVDRIEDNCGSYPTEVEARAVARGYAEMYKAEHDAQLAEALADPRTIAAEPTIARLQATTPADGAELDMRVGITANMDAVNAELRAEVQADTATAQAATADPAESWAAFRQGVSRTASPRTDLMQRLLDNAVNGYIPRGGQPGQANTRQLIGLKARGLVVLDYRKVGNRREIAGAWTTSVGAAA